MSPSGIREAPRASAHGLPASTPYMWVRDAQRFSMLHIVHGDRTSRVAICGADTGDAHVLTAFELLQGKRCAECEENLSSPAERD